VLLRLSPVLLKQPPAPPKSPKAMANRVKFARFA
jgi:hypothetical protein